MAKQVLHEGEVYELRGDGWTGSLLEDMKIDGRYRKVLIVSPRSGARVLVPVRQLRWLGEGELKREIRVENG